MTLAYLVACGTSETSAPVASLEVTALAIDPAASVVQTSGADPATIQYVATATFVDGTSAPIDLVSWSLSSFAAGQVDSTGLFTASTENGAVSTVVAEHAGITAYADLTVVYREVIDDAGGALAVEDFDGSTSGSVAWIYPEDAVSVPRNIPSLTFMWEPVSGATGYRVGFTTEITEIYALTTDTHASIEASLWNVIAATNAGGEVAVEIRALTGSGVAVSEVRTVRVNRLDADGSIYYWSTSDAGIVKVPIDAEEPELFYAPNRTAPNCVACHTVRDDRMSVAYGIEGALEFYSGLLDVSGDEPVELTQRDRRGYYSTLDPQAERMLTSEESGVLNLWDARTGTWLKQSGIDGVVLTQPDWSPDGDQIVAVAARQMYGDCCFTEGKLVLIPIDESGNLGAATTLYEPEYQAANTLNVFYPAFSPDGRWVAFNMALGSSYDNENAQLYVISVDGGEPIPLAAANFAEGITNSWPHWGPLPDDEVFWLAFASKRAYGDIVNDGVTDPSLLQSQIWVAAFRPALAEAGGDPSSPAFWLPNQDPETSNHTSYWGR